VLLNKFLTSLTALTGATVQPVVLATDWAANPPADAPPGVALGSYLNLTYPILISKQQIELVRDPFYSDYAAVHDGRLPFVDPVPLARWAFGDSYPASALTDGLNNKTVFMNWFQGKYLHTVSDASQCSSAIMLYVGGTGSQNPRNQYLSKPGAPTGFSSGRISPLSEVPDNVLPIGQVSSFSAITNHTEFLPVSVDVMVAKGCDGLIPRMAMDLIKVGAVVVPEVGQTIMGGDILMKRRAEEKGIEDRVRYVA
jgi:hypothetical protein